MSNFLSSALFSGTVQEGEDEPAVASLFDHLHLDTFQATSAPSDHLLEPPTPLYDPPDAALNVISRPESSLTNGSHDTQETLSLPTNITKINSAIVVLPRDVGKRRLEICQEACKAVAFADANWRAKPRKQEDSFHIYLQTENSNTLVECLQVCQESLSLQLDVGNTTSSWKQLRSTTLVDIRQKSQHGQVYLNPGQQNEGARPVLVPRGGVDVLLTDVPTPFFQTVEEFREGLAHTLVDRLEELRLNQMDYLLKIHIGTLRLQTYKKQAGALSITHFIEMLNEPRTTVRLDEAIGNANIAKSALDAIRGDDGVLFPPADPSLRMAAEVVPKYTIEASQGIYKVVASLSPPAATITGGKYSISEVSTRRLDASPLFQIHVIRLGQSVDWKFETTENNYSIGDVHCLFGSAQVDFREDEIGTFPVLRGSPDFNDFVVKTTYEFYWHTTADLVQVSVDRRWDSTKSCTNGVSPIPSLSITLCNEPGDLSVEEATKLAGDVEDLASIVGDML